jgi:hypothetical protein
MKTQLLKLVAVGIILMTAAVACNKDPKGGGGSDSAFVINATNIEGVDDKDQIDNVKALVYSEIENYPAGTAKFQNNGFKVNLCATVPDNHLGSWDIICWGASGIVSDTSAKVNYTHIIACNSAGREIGAFWFFEEKDMYCFGRYLYADRDFTIKGNGIMYTYDCDLKKGWNIVYHYHEGGGKITTQKPSGVNLEWHYFRH